MKTRRLKQLVVSLAVCILLLGGMAIGGGSEAFAARHQKNVHRGSDSAHHKPAVHARPERRNVRVVNRRYTHHEGRNYRYHDGRRYTRVVTRYVAPPPLGAIFVNLPFGYRTAMIRGIPYYSFGGVYYRRVPAGYIVVEAPIGF